MTTVTVTVYANDDLVTPINTFDTALEAQGENLVNGIAQGNYIVIHENDSYALGVLNDTTGTAIDKWILVTQTNPITALENRVALFICKEIEPQIREDKNGKPGRRVIKISGPNKLFELSDRTLGNVYIAHTDTGTISADALTETTAKIIPGDADYKSDDYYNGWTILTDDGFVGIIEDYRASDGFFVLAGDWEGGTNPSAGANYELKSGVTTEDVDQVMEFAPSGWSYTHTVGGAKGSELGTSFVAAGESVFEGLKKIQEMSGEIFLDENGTTPTRQVAWVRSPSTGAGTFRNDVTQSEYELGTYIPILDISRKRSEKDRVTRLIPYGGNKLTIALAEGEVSVPTGFSVDWDNNLITNTAAETDGATIRYGENTWPEIKVVKNEDLPASEQVPETAAAIALFNAAIAFLTFKAARRVEYVIRCVSRNSIIPGRYYNIDYNGDINITGSAFAHKVVEKIKEDGFKETTVYLATDHYAQPQTFGKQIANFIHNFQNYQRHNVGGSGLYLSVPLGAIDVPGGTNDHGALLGLSDDDHGQYALLNGRDGDILKIDEIRAYDAAGLKLYDDSGAAGLSIADGGNVSVTTGNSLRAEHVRALNSSGLKLYDDGGNGIFVEDGGQVGIGTESPAAGLHVYNASNNSQIIIESTQAANFPVLQLKDTGHSGAADDDWNIENGRAGQGVLGFYHDGTKIVFDDDGYVGIGATTPQNHLHISGAGPVLGRIEATTASSYSGIVFEGDSYSSAIYYGGTTQGTIPETLAVYVNSSAMTGYALVVDESGNIGIGPTNPSYKLHITGGGIGVDGDLTFIGPQAITTTSGDLTLNIAGNNIFLVEATDIGYQNYDPPGSQGFTTGWKIDTGDGAGYFEYLEADEMHIRLFQADITMAKANGFIVSDSVAVLASDFTVPAVSSTGTLTVDDNPALGDAQVFDDDDWVRLRYFERSTGLFLYDVWGQVASYVDNSNETQSWTFTTRYAGPSGQAVGNLIKTGAPVIGYGKSGDGWWEVDASKPDGPFASVGTWSGANPYTSANRNTHTMTGYLNSITSKGEYGFYAGVSPAGPRVIVSDISAEIHQIPLSLYSGTSDSATIALYAFRMDSDVESNITPNGDGTETNIVLVSGSGDAYTYIDDDPESPNADYIRNTAGENASAFFLLTDISHTLTSLTWQAYITNSAYTDDSLILTAQIFKADETTPLTEEVKVATLDTADGLVEGEFTDIESGTDAEWAAARVRIRWVYHVGGGDEVIRLEPSMETGPYIAVGNPIPTKVFGENTEGLWVGKDPSDGNYKFRIGGGNDASSAAALTYSDEGLYIWASDDHTNAVITFDNSGNSYFTGVMTIDTSGAIRQGTGTWGSNFDGIQIYNNSGVGNFSCYNNDNEVATLNENGLDITIEDSTSFTNERALTFSDGSGNVVMGIWGRYSTGNSYETHIGSGDPNLTTGIAAPTTRVFSYGDTGERATTLIYSANEDGDTAAVSVEVGSAINGRQCTIDAAATGITGGLLIGDTVTASAISDGQLQLDQGTGDYTILSLRSSDMTNGTTQGMDDNAAFFRIIKFSAANGGANLKAGSDGSETGALALVGSADAADSATASTSSKGPVMLVGQVDNTNVGSGNNCIVMRSDTLARWVMRGDGTVYMDSTDSESAFDAENDISLTRAAQIAMSNGNGIIQDRWDEFIEHSRDDLERLDIVTKTGFINQQNIIKLYAGAIWQLNKRIAQLEAQLA